MYSPYFRTAVRTGSHARHAPRAPDTWPDTCSDTCPDT